MTNVRNEAREYLTLTGAEPKAVRTYLDDPAGFDAFRKKTDDAYRPADLRADFDHYDDDRQDREAAERRQASKAAFLAALTKVAEAYFEAAEDVEDDVAKARVHERIGDFVLALYHSGDGDQDGGADFVKGVLEGTDGF